MYLRQERNYLSVQESRHPNGEIPYATITMHDLAPERSKFIALDSAAFFFNHHGQRH